MIEKQVYKSKQNNIVFLAPWLSFAFANVEVGFLWKHILSVLAEK